MNGKKWKKPQKMGWRWPTNKTRDDFIINWVNEHDDYLLIKKSETHTNVSSMFWLARHEGTKLDASKCSRCTAFSLAFWLHIGGMWAWTNTPQPVELVKQKQIKLMMHQRLDITLILFSVSGFSSLVIVKRIRAFKLNAFSLWATLNDDGGDNDGNRRIESKEWKIISFKKK